MGLSTTVSLQVKDNKDFLRVMEFAEHCKHDDVDFGTEPKKLELSWSGRNEAGGWAEEVAESVVAHFPDIYFRISSFCDMGFEMRYGVSERGKIKWFELSDEVKEMFEWGIDVDPYEAPTPEHFEQLRRYRRERVREMIDLGVHISPDTWPPSREQLDEEIRLRSAKSRPMNEEEKKEAEDLGLPF